MRFLLKAFFALLLIGLVGLPLAVLAAMFFAFDDQPSLTRSAEIKPESVARAKRIIERNDPRRMPPGMLRSIVVGGDDLDLAINYLANQHGRGSASVKIQEGLATARASLPMPSNPFGKFLNIETVFVEAEGLPHMEMLKVGRLPVPGLLADRAVQWGIAKWSEGAEAGKALDAIKRVSMRDGALMVTYEWSDALPGALAGLVLSAEDGERLKAYQALVAKLSETGQRGPLAMERILQAMLALGMQRGGDAVAENRAALLTLAFFINGKGLGTIYPAAKTWPRPAARNVTLAGRHDFAQHFSVSAALAATAGSPLADAVGLFKEIDDSRGGSGFSFNDIAADRAGTRFGELATSSPAGASRAQRLGTAGLAAGAIFPQVADLPEFMAEAEFKRRYGGTGGAEYKRMMAEIERRIAALPAYSR
jgi:hypothetical protein